MGKLYSPLGLVIWVPLLIFAITFIVMAKIYVSDVNNVKKGDFWTLMATEEKVEVVHVNPGPNGLVWFSPPLFDSGQKRYFNYTEKEKFLEKFRKR